LRNVFWESGSGGCVIEILKNKEGSDDIFRKKKLNSPTLQFSKWVFPKLPKIPGFKKTVENLKFPLISIFSFSGFQ
jgi:hypothetical protein